MKNAKPLTDKPQLVLNEDELIRMAVLELRGRRPPSYNFADDEFAQSTEPKKLSASSRKKPTTSIQRELDSRAWTITDFAVAAGIPTSEAASLAKGNSRISRELAKILGEIFATSVDFWLEK